MLYSRAQLEVYRAASDERGRYALNGVLLEPDGTTVAADGTMLMAVEPAEVLEPETYPLEHVAPKTEGVIVPAGTLKDALKALPKARYTAARPVLGYAALTHCDGQVEFTTTDGEHTQKVEAIPVEGQFPNYREVFPSFDAQPQARICLDAEYLRTICDLVIKASGRRRSDETPNTITLQVHGARQPVLIRAETADGQHMVGLLSPIVRENIDDGQWDGDESHDLAAPQVSEWEKAFRTRKPAQ